MILKNKKASCSSGHWPFSYLLLSIIFLSIDSNLTFALASYNLQDDSVNYSTRQKLSMDKGWRFFQGDILFPIIKGHGPSYHNAKAGKAYEAAAAEFDDSQWRTVKLPHDWASESPPDSTENLAQGYRKRGIGWYRRQFKLEPLDRGKHLEIQFDGIATFASIWVNGFLVHRNWCGYTSSYIDITEFAKFGDELNTISVRVDANAQEGWWYEGAGIYRHTWLIKRSPVHLITDGVFVNPVRLNANSWQIPAEITIENAGNLDTSGEVVMSLWDNKGKLIVEKSSSFMVNKLGQALVKIVLPVSQPSLWSTENPILYRVKTQVRLNGKITDSLTSTCGFRTIRFDADLGFFLNDKPVKLKGVCNHQDHAGVGVAMPDALWEFKLRKLKEMGVNAYRCAHNPPSVEFLDLCDKMGIMVMDENRNFNSSPEYIRQLQWLVRRDRNHPSVILWSIFNEEPMQGTEIGYEMVRRMSAEVKKLDHTRPVTAAMNGGFFSAINVSAAVDVAGFNYQIGNYDRFHKENPKLPLTSSEDVSAFMTRGEYQTNKSKNILSSYDTESAAWGVTHRVGWKVIAERPYLAGAFVWTGFDYHGEPTPHKWPSNSSFFGIMDICGFPKAAYYLHQAQWLENKPILQLIPHWNWPADSLGKKIKVMAFSNAEKVKLILNEKILGEQVVDKYEMNTWEVPYQPGKLEAIGYHNNKEVSRFVVETTGEAVGLKLVPDRKSLLANGNDAMPVTVMAIDAKGRPVQTANFPIDFELGKGLQIIGLGNGDPNSHEPEKGSKRSLFNGLAQVIIESTDTLHIPFVKLTAKSPGLKTATLAIAMKAVDPVPSVAVVTPALVLDKWFMSAITTTKPDPLKNLQENDMNSLEPVKPGQLQPILKDGFVLYRTTFDFPKNVKDRELIFRQLAGKAEIWINGKLSIKKDIVAENDWKVKFMPINGVNTITVIFETKIGAAAGFGGMIISRNE